jgi:hypothetical protein
MNVMPFGELITRATVWLALAGYACSLVFFLFAHGRRNWDVVARIFWTIACIALFAHILSAYHFFHNWSHSSAYLETARQTSEVYGLYWGGGLYINLLLMIGWIVDVIWWWSGLEKYRNRPAVVTITWHVFLYFIFFNATVVFEGGILRWVGLLFTAAVASVFLYRVIKNSTRSSVVS